MADLKFDGSTPGVNKIKLGSSNVQKIYNGSTLVWPEIDPDYVAICELGWQKVNTSIVNKIGGGTIPILDNANDLWQALENQEPAACYFQFNQNNSEYGLVYNYYAKDVVEPPAGYRLPTSQDFTVLDSISCKGNSSQNSNRYGADPGNWDMTRLTNTDELGDSGFDSQGYGWAVQTSSQTVFWLSLGIQDGYWIDNLPGASIKGKGFRINPLYNTLTSLSYSVNSPFRELLFIRFVKDL